MEEGTLVSRKAGTKARRPTMHYLGGEEGQAVGLWKNLVGDEGDELRLRGWGQAQEGRQSKGPVF